MSDPRPSPPGEVLLRARGITKRFGGRVALRGVDLALRAGEVVGLAGPNGAGKTTLARLAAGFLHPSTGEVRLGDLAPATFRARHGVGYLPEEAPRLWGCTPETLLARRPLARRHGTVPEDLPSTREGVREPTRAGDLLARLGLGGLAQTALPRLSRGQWRLALSAFALHGPAPLVVLDEPDAGLDPAALDRLAEGVRWAGRAGALVLVLSHQMAELEAMCDRILFLADGRVVGEARAAELRPGEARARYRELMR
ncbi:MAG TPA: ATP-binding cassette domain-containing protein [Longimicrobiales bacterium]|nr:ATP-binding cassette domain-containing protein [Longimicrobiales bacterium]